MYRLARCRECKQEIHVHKKGRRTVLKNLCQHVTSKDDIFFDTDKNRMKMSKIKGGKYE